MFLPRSVAGPWRRTRRCGSGFPFIVLPKVVTPAGWSAQARDGGLRVDAVVAEDGVQGGLVVPGTFGQALEGHQTRRRETAPGGVWSPVSPSMRGVVGVRMAPAPRVAPRRTRAPPTTMHRDPTNASSSTTTGTAFGGSRTPPAPPPPAGGAL